MPRPDLFHELARLCAPEPSAAAYGDRILRCRDERHHPTTTSGLTRLVALGLIENALRAPLGRLDERDLLRLFAALARQNARHEARLVALAPATRPELALGLRAALAALDPKQANQALLAHTQDLWPDRVPTPVDLDVPAPAWTNTRARLLAHPDRVGLTSLLREALEAGVSAEEVRDLGGQVPERVADILAGRGRPVRDLSPEDQIRVARVLAAHRHPFPPGLDLGRLRGGAADGLRALEGRAWDLRAWLAGVAALDGGRAREELAWFARASDATAVLDADIRLDLRVTFAVERVLAATSQRGARRAFAELLRVGAEPPSAWARGKAALLRPGGPPPAWTAWLERHRARDNHRDVMARIATERGPGAVDALHAATGDPIALTDAFFETLWPTLSSAARASGFVRLLRRLAPGDSGPLFHAIQRWVVARKGIPAALPQVLVLVEMLVYGLSAAKLPYRELAEELGQRSPRTAGRLLSFLPDDDGVRGLRLAFAYRSGVPTKLRQAAKAVEVSAMAEAILTWLDGRFEAAVPSWAEAADLTDNGWVDEVWPVLGLLLASDGALDVARLTALKPLGRRSARLVDGWREAAFGQPEVDADLRAALRGDERKLAAFCGIHGTPAPLERELLTRAADGSTFTISQDGWRVTDADRAQLEAMLLSGATAHDAGLAEALASRVLTEEEVGLYGATLALDNLTHETRLELLLAAGVSGPRLTEAIRRAEPAQIVARQFALAELAASACDAESEAALAAVSPFLALRVQTWVPGGRRERQQLRALLARASAELAATAADDERRDRATVVLRWTRSAEDTWMSLFRGNPAAARSARSALQNTVDTTGTGPAGRSVLLRTKTGTDLLGIGKKKDSYRLVVTERERGIDILRVFQVSEKPLYNRALEKDAQREILAEPVVEIPEDHPMWTR